MTRFLLVILLRMLLLHSFFGAAYMPNPLDFDMENDSEAPNQSQIVEYRNYKRMGRGCLQAAAEVPSVGDTLVFLDLSGNKLGDEGVCNLAKVATAFTLTAEEVAMRRLLKMKMILGSNDILDAVKSRVDLENDTSTLSRIAVSVVRKRYNRKKGTLRKVKALSKEKERTQTDGRNLAVKETLTPTEKAFYPLTEVGCAPENPLLAEEEGTGPFGMRIRGNYQLAMLNLSRNLITDFGVGLLTKALATQTSSLLEGNFSGGVGLTDILLKGNKFNEAGAPYKNLLDELRRKRDFTGEESTKTGEGIKLDGRNQL